MQLPKIKNKIFIFVVTLTACAFDIVNVTATILSVDSIAKKYSVDSFIASWVLSAYAVTFSGFIAFLGRVSDIVGHTAFFAASCFAFSLFSLLSAAIDNVYALIVFRAFQGVAAAGVVPSGYSIISYTFDGKHQDRALASLASVFSASFGLGFIIGGAFEESLVGYKGTLYMSFGLILLVAIFSLSFEKIEPNGRSFKSLDFSGCVLFVSGAILVVVGLTEGGDTWKSARAIAPLIVGIIFLTFFFVWNGYIAELPSIQERLPFLKLVSLLVPKEIWQTRNSVLLLIAMLINYIVCFGVLLVAVQYCELVEENTPLISALKTLPLVLSMIACTVAFAFKSDYLTTIQAFCIGYVLMVAGTGILIALPRVSDPFWKIILVSEVLANAGTAFYFVYCITYLIGKAHLSVKGIMSGVCQTFSQFGSALAFSAITSIMGNTTGASKEVLKLRLQKSTYFLFGSTAFGMLLMVVVVIRDCLVDTHVKEYDQEDLSEEAKFDQKSMS